MARQKSTSEYRWPAQRATWPTLGLESKSFQSAIKLIGLSMPVRKNAEIYGQNEFADYIYKVLSGTVRSYTILDDGRRQISAFHFPGDIFGLEIGDAHTFSSEAVVDFEDTVDQTQLADRNSRPRQQDCTRALVLDRG